MWNFILLRIEGSESHLSVFKEAPYWSILSYNYDTYVIIEHMSIGFIQTMVVFIINYIKSDNHHHVIIKHIAPYAECADGIAKSAQWRYTHGFSMGMTSLCWLCYPVRKVATWRDVQLSHLFIRFFFLNKSTMICIKPTDMCSIITSVHEDIYHQYSSPLSNHTFIPVSSLEFSKITVWEIYIIFLIDCCWNDTFTILWFLNCKCFIVSYIISSFSVL